MSICGHLLWVMWPESVWCWQQYSNCCLVVSHYVIQIQIQNLYCINNHHVFTGQSLILMSVSDDHLLVSGMKPNTNYNVVVEARKMHSYKDIQGKILTFNIFFIINSLWPSDAIWRHRSGSTLAQVMACCQTAPRLYLNHCWLIINMFQWQSPKSYFTINTSAINY